VAKGSFRLVGPYFRRAEERIPLRKALEAAPIIEDLMDLTTSGLPFQRHKLITTSARLEARR